MTLVIVLATLGIMLSIRAHWCAEGQVPHPEEIRLFRMIPWSVVGVIGYTVIAATAPFPHITRGLVLIAGIITALLAQKAFRANIFCPFCIMVWALNFGLIIAVFT